MQVGDLMVSGLLGLRHCYRRMVVYTVVGFGLWVWGLGAWLLQGTGLPENLHPKP